MINRIRTLIVASVLSLSAGFSAASYGQQMGAGGPPPGGPGPSPGPGGGAPPNNGGFGGPGMSGRDAVLPSDFTRSPGQEWPQPGGSRSPLPGSPPSRTPGDDLDKSVPLNYAVSMVQERFNATAVKTDTVLERGQWVYRIRLLSADKSKVWTVSVDARTGRVN